MASPVAVANFEIEGPVFIPNDKDEYYRIVAERYNAARGEAASLAAKKSIEMRVEFFKPVHFGWTIAPVLGRYMLPTGTTTVTLKENTAFFPAGLLNLDSCFDYMKWWEGAGTKYLSDWFTLPVFYYRDHQGAYKGNLKGYEFRGAETFRFQVHCTSSPDPGIVNAWIYAFIVLPATMSETTILQ